MDVRVMDEVSFSLGTIENTNITKFLINTKHIE